MGLRTVLLGHRNNMKTGYYSYVCLLRPCFRTCDLFCHFWGQQHCLGLDRGTCSLDHELFADRDSAEYLRWYHRATGFKTPLRVLAITLGHLELVLGAVKGQNTQALKLAMNEKYGEVMVRKARKIRKIRSRSSRRRIRFKKRLLLGVQSQGGWRERSGAVSVDPYILIYESLFADLANLSPDSNAEGWARKRVSLGALSKAGLKER